MNEPQQENQQTQGVLPYARPGSEVPSGLSAGVLCLICVGVGAVGLGLPLCCGGGFGMRFLGTSLGFCGAFGAVILGLAGLISRDEPGERRPGAALGLLLGLLLFAALYVCFGPQNSRERSNRVNCASNLRQIGQGILLYANDHGNRMPAAIEDLHLSADLGPEIFVCPCSSATKSAGATTQQVLADLRAAKHCSYAYYGAGMTWPVHPDIVLASEPLQNHGKDGSNILFGDGHVEWVAAKTAVKVLAELAAGQNPPPSLAPPQPATGRSP